MQRRSAEPIFVQLFTAAAQAVIFAPALVAEQIGNIFPFKIAVLGNIIPAAQALGIRLSKHPDDFIRRQDIIPAFHSVAVSILAAVELAVRSGQLPQNIVQCIRSDAPVDRVSCLFIRFKICIGQQCIVVEHFFKMRHQPA